MAISGALSFGGNSVAFDSGWSGVLTLYHGTATFSWAALAVDSSRHHWCGGPAGDGLSGRGFRCAKANAQLSSDRSADSQGDEAERSHLCLGKFAAALQLFRPAHGDTFCELFTSCW